MRPRFLVVAIILLLHVYAYGEAAPVGRGVWLRFREGHGWNVHGARPQDASRDDEVRLEMGQVWF